MPDRILRADFGESMGEMGLSWGAAGAYTYFQRAFDNFGCARDNRPIIKLKAFLSWRRPSVSDLDRYIEEYVTAGLLEVTDGWIYLTRWFKDNRFYGKLRPVAPMPKYMKQYMSEEQWSSANKKAFDEVSAAMGAKKDALGDVPDSPGRSRTVPPKAKQSKAKQPNKGYATDWPEKDFRKIFRDCWNRSPSAEQTRRAKEWHLKYGWDKLDAAMKTIGGDYGFKYVGNVLQGLWNQSKGQQGKPGRHHVDED